MSNSLTSVNADASGILLLDKPVGMTSAHAVAKVKRKLGFKKIGHCGTLDPLATGLLVLLYGKATKRQAEFMAGTKVYAGVIRLGIVSATDDMEGEIVSTADSAKLLKLSDSDIQSLIPKFTGTVEQRPPIYSALKIAGKRSYDLARSGKEVEHAPRKIEIFELRLKFLDSEHLEYWVHCGKGTYVRALARDIGEELGVGACLESIRRLRSGDFSVEEAYTLEDLEQGLVNVGIDK